MIASLTVFLGEFECDVTGQACLHINYSQTFVLDQFQASSTHSDSANLPGDDAV